MSGNQGVRRGDTAMTADIAIVGGGIYPDGEMTLGALATLRRCAAIATVPVPPLRAFLERQGLTFHDLSDLYVEGKDRDAIYREIAATVLRLAETQRPVAYLTYGHPMWLDEPVRLILKGAAAAGLSTAVLPGISFVDTILASRAIAIGATGFRVLTAASLIAGDAALDPATPTFIAQIAGLAGGAASGTSPLALSALTALTQRLLRDYPGDHRISLCDSDETGRTPIVVELPLSALPVALDGITYATTLYLPAALQKADGP